MAIYPGGDGSEFQRQKRLLDEIMPPDRVYTQKDLIRLGLAKIEKYEDTRPVNKSRYEERAKEIGSSEYYQELRRKSRRSYRQDYMDQFDDRELTIEEEMIRILVARRHDLVIDDRHKSVYTEYISRINMLENNKPAESTELIHKCRCTFYYEEEQFYGGLLNGDSGKKKPVVLTPEFFYAAPDDEANKQASMTVWIGQCKGCLKIYWDMHVDNNQDKK